LSGGERQRAAVARALFGEPDLILADEPSGNLDRENAERLGEILTELHGQGITILLVTHDGDMARFASRQLRLADGALVEA